MVRIQEEPEGHMTVTWQQGGFRWSPLPKEVMQTYDCKTDKNILIVGKLVKYQDFHTYNCLLCCLVMSFRPIYKVLLGLLCEITKPENWV